MSIVKKIQNNVKVEISFDPRIGKSAWRDYYKMSDRCTAINQKLRPIIPCIDFDNPYTYGYRPVKKFIFELDEKIWLPEKKRKALAKILRSKKLKALGVKSFRICRVTETTIIRREFKEEIL